MSFKIKWSQKETYIKIEFLFAIGLFEKVKYLFSCFLNLCSGPNKCYLFIFLLNEIERMIYIFERCLSINSKLCHLRLSF